MTQKIQFYPADLAYALDIGEIADMYVATLDSGVQVLRIECAEKKDDEYKTVRVKGSKKAAPVKHPQRGREKRESSKPEKAPDLSSKKAMGIGDQLLNAGKKFMSNKSKPPWME